MAIEHPPLQRDYLAAMEKISMKIEKRRDSSVMPASRYIGEFSLKHESVIDSFKRLSFEHAYCFEPDGEEQPGLYHTKAALNGMLFAYAMNSHVVSPSDWVHMRDSMAELESNVMDIVVEDELAIYQQIINDVEDDDDDEEVCAASSRATAFITGQLAQRGLLILGDPAKHDAAVWADATINKPEYHDAFVNGFGFMAFAGIEHLARKYPDFYAEHKFTNAERIGNIDD